MIERLVVAFVFAFVLSAAIAGDTYRWEDEDGNVYYSDQLPPTGARNVQRTRDSGSVPEQSLPYRLQVVVAKFPVTLFVTDCGRPCDRARELLIRRGVPHTLLDVSRAEVKEQLLALTKGELEVPVVQIGKTVLRGYEVGQWNAALDAAGYPAYPMIEVKPTVPQPALQAAGQETDTSGVEATDGAEIDSGETVTGDDASDALEGDNAEPAAVEENQ